MFVLGQQQEVGELEIFAVVWKTPVVTLQLQNKKRQQG